MEHAVLSLDATNSPKLFNTLRWKPRSGTLSAFTPHRTETTKTHRQAVSLTLHLFIYGYIYIYGFHYIIGFHWNENKRNDIPDICTLLNHLSFAAALNPNVTNPN